MEEKVELPEPKPEAKHYTMELEPGKMVLVLQPIGEKDDKPIEH